MLWLYLFVLGTALSTGPKEPFDAAQWITLFFEIFIGVNYHKGKTKVNSLLLVPPVGIAMKSKERTGEMYWCEARNLSSLGGSSVFLGITRIRRPLT